MEGMFKMARIIAASQNKDKIHEIEAITKKFGMDTISRDDAGVPKVEIEEDGETFEENSYKKAYEVMKLCGETTIADDSGLMVDYIDGAPGVYSARFSGENATYDSNNDKLLDMLNGVPYEKRTAKFVTVITLVRPDGSKLIARGECPGHIAEEKREGKDGFGFGYDPVFIPEGYSETFAELGSEIKNEVGHRAKALMELERLLTCYQEKE